ncbi:MAG: hypothetical protein KC619_28230 [Myxococcales bacterium]|nr:hypothetical protein [Myxococcales bacterium]
MRSGRSILAALLAVACAPPVDTVQVVPGRFSQDLWAEVELRVLGVDPSLLLVGGPAGVAFRADVSVALGDTPAHPTALAGDDLYVALDAEPPLGWHPLVVRHAAGVWTSESPVEVFADDPPLPPPSRLGEWSSAGALPRVVAEGDCAAGAAVTPDGRWLVVLGPVSGRCDTGRLGMDLYEWSDGAPVATGSELTGASGGTRTLAFADGARAGVSAAYVLVAATNAGRIEQATVSGDPPSVADVTALEMGDSATLCEDGSILVFARDGVLFERRQPLIVDSDGGVEITGLPGVVVGEPAISGDGLVLVYAARATAGADADLYLARRDAPDAPWVGVGPLPKGDGLVNSDADEAHPSIAPTGQLLFVSARDLARIFVAALPE